MPKKGGKKKKGESKANNGSSQESTPQATANAPQPQTSGNQAQTNPVQQQQRQQPCRPSSDSQYPPLQQNQQQTAMQVSSEPNLGMGRGRGRGRERESSSGSQGKMDFPALGQTEQRPSFWAQPRQQTQPISSPSQTKQTHEKLPSAQLQSETQKPPLEKPQSDSQLPKQNIPQQQPLKEADVQQVQEALSKVSVKEQSPRVTSLQSSPSLPIMTVPRQIANAQLQNIPKRKNPNQAGKLGRPIQVLTNMMQIKFGPKFKHEVIHYDVDIDPNLPKYLMRPIFEQARQKLFPNRNPAFDGKKNAFSAGYLPIDCPASTEVTVCNEDGREKHYKVTFQVANTIDLSWLKSVKPGLRETERDQISLQALDIILRSAPALRSTSVGRSFFSPPKGQIVSLGGGMDLWVGLFQSSVLGWKPYLNVDVAHKGFPKEQGVLDLMKTICGCDSEDQQGGRQQFGRGQQQSYGRQGYGQQQQGPRELNEALINEKKDEIKKFLRGLKVIIEIPGQPTSRRTQRVHDLVKAPKDDFFEHDGSKVSVMEYFRKEKKYNIKYPSFPCLWVGARDKNIHVPPEICRIVAGQAVQKKLDEKQTSTMIKFAATGTEDRKRKIMEAFSSMNHNQDKTMREFDISISGEFEKVPARVLDPPQLCYQNNKITRVSRGVWRAEKFTKPSPLISRDGSWTILNLNRQTRENDLYELQNAIMRTANSVGMSIGKALTPFTNLQLRGSDTRELLSYFEQQKQKQLKLIVVIVPEMKGPYSKVKQITELNVGVLTQCIKGQTLRRLSDATIGNILLKINAKLDGVNHTFELTKSRPKCLAVPCMIVGADVTHPSPDATDIPSIAAVAASHDPNAFQYNIEIRLQPPKQEIIGELAGIMRIQLIYFYKKTGHKPAKIIFYRDGVSEGQFGQIMHAELRAVRSACKSLQADYEPKITFLVVQKRHHIRLFPTDPRNSDDERKGFNVQAGTIVDTEITHPSDIDFYLVSHASIQGTARPTKYRCLWDDNNMSEDEIENLTYFLCHMFSRCTRSVSYPTPTYYAHLAAFRARALTQDISINMDNLPQEQVNKLTVKSEVLKETPMFFV